MRIRKVLAVSSLGAVTLIAAASALAAHFASSRQDASVRITTGSVSGLGKILVNNKGFTLYMFVPDKRSRVTCVSVCAKIWPPVKLAAGAKVIAAGGVKQSLLGSDKDPAGGRVVTYHGWPLYLYLGDRRPGVASGQALNLNGGLWYVLSPSGAVIKVKPHQAGSGGGGGSGGSTTTQTGPTSTVCSDDDGDGDQSAGGPDDGDGCI
jgi:predicted lipoprotein with Yx(FWY)xxD motif